MAKNYTPVNWKNSRETELTAENLNIMDSGIDDVDTRLDVVETIMEDVENKSNVSPTFTNVNSGINMVIGSDNVALKLFGTIFYGTEQIRNQEDIVLTTKGYHYIAYDTDTKVWGAYSSITEDLTKKCIILGCVYIADIATGDVMFNTNANIKAYINGAKYDSDYTFYHNMETCGVDFYNKNLIIPPSSFNMLNDNRATSFDKNGIPLPSGSNPNILFLDYNTDKISVVDFSVGPYLHQDNRYKILGYIWNNGRLVVSNNLKINRDGNTYLNFGDSIQTNVKVTDAEGKTIYGSAGFQVAQSVGMNPRNYAVSGMGFVREINGNNFYAQLVSSGSTYSDPSRIPKAGSLIGGVNDFKHSVPIGDVETEGTFAYEVNRCFKYIYDNYFQIPFLVCTPLKCTGWSAANNEGATLADYANVIKERAKHYKLRFYDLFNDDSCDFTYNNSLMPDGIHPNYFGHKRIAPLIRSLIICP